MDSDKQSSSSSSSDEEESFRQFCGNGKCLKAAEIEAKLDKGNIEAAESSLKDGLSVNSEQARALLGRLEYQRGRVDSALRVLEGVDLNAAILRLQSEKQSSKKGSDSQRATGLILQAIYIKAKCLQKRRKVKEATKECKRIIDAVEKIFGKSIPGAVDSKLKEIINRASALYPELLKQAGSYNKAIAASRRALLSQWNLDNHTSARIQKGLAVLMLYSGTEANPPNLAAEVDGSYVPKNNLEEAILSLMIALRKVCVKKSMWDPSVLEHLTFALSLCSQTSVLAKQLEEVMPGILHRIDRWNTLALCLSGEGENKVALNLLRKSLNKNEKPDDLIALLLAAKLCSEDCLLAGEGVGYAQRAVDNACGKDEHLKGVGLRMLGLCLGMQAKVSCSDSDRSRCQAEALKSLDSALSLENNNLDLIYELGVQFAEQRNLNAALRCAKKFIDATGGSSLKGWRLLALVLSAQQRFSESVLVTDAALEETVRWDQGPLLRLKAKLKVSQSRPMDAIETYRYLLALVQAQKKSPGPDKCTPQIEDGNVDETEVWHGLANLYSSLSHYNDAEVCLGKARDLNRYSAEVLHIEGKILEGQGAIQDALSSNINALWMEPSHVACKVRIGALLSKTGPETMPVVKSILSDALRLEPTNRMAWYYLGVVHKSDGRLADAADCFQAASMLEESDPIESFSFI